MNIGVYNHQYGLEKHGIENVGKIYWSCPTAILYEEAIKRGEGVVASGGALVVKTGQYTGRSPNDRFVVEEETTKDSIRWGGSNRAISKDKFDNLFLRLQAYLQGKDIFVQDCYAGADPNYRLPIRVITGDAWHSLFARNIFIRITEDRELKNFVPLFTVINAPDFHANPEFDGTSSEAFILVNFQKRLILIGGTSYAGEIKKSIFSVMNYLLPEKSILPMHCAVNKGKDGEVALFFGLSGTGKTTLSAESNRSLIGDDEHGWTDQGVFNFEGGCYAKVINLSPQEEPQIYSCTHRFGTLLENVKINYKTREIDLYDGILTENTRAAYPIKFIDNHEESGGAGHPRNVIFLTCDAFGILPPLSKLTWDQAMYHFISGYSAKLGGAERGISVPKVTFSSCFGAAFMVRSPAIYARLLGEKIKKHQVNCWLLNTGWTGGPYGVGKRIPIDYSRRLLNYVLDGKFNGFSLKREPFFNLEYPGRIPGVPREILNQDESWVNKTEYEKKALELVELFKKNFEEHHQDFTESLEGK